MPCLSAGVWLELVAQPFRGDGSPQITLFLVRLRPLASATLREEKSKMKFLFPSSSESSRAGDAVTARIHLQVPPPGSALLSSSAGHRPRPRTPLHPIACCTPALVTAGPWLGPLCSTAQAFEPQPLILVRSLWGRHCMPGVPHRAGPAWPFPRMPTLLCRAHCALLVVVAPSSH